MGIAMDEWSNDNGEIYGCINRADEWGEAETLFRDWFATIDDPEMRFVVAKWAQKSFWVRLMRMSSINKPTFAAYYNDLKEDLDHAIAYDRKLLEER
jgi:hypothetical protein